MRAASVLLEGLADERLWRTREEQVRRFLQDVRDHDEAEVEALLVADVLHRFDELRLEIHDFLRVHDRDLADDDAVVADLELLEVVLGDLSRRHVADAGTSLEHRHAVFLDIDAGDLSEALCRLLVVRRAGRALEEDRIREDGREQEACDGCRDVDIILPVHVRDDRGRAADRLSMREDRLARLDAAEAMVVDDLEDLGFLDALDGLAALIVVDEDDAVALRQHEVVAADEADKAAVFDDGVIPVARLLHRALDVREQVERLEADRVRMHDAADRHALVDQAGYRIRVIRRREDEDVLCLSGFDDISRDTAIARDDEAGDALIDDVDERLIVAVADEHDVVLLDRVLDHLDRAGSDADLAVDEVALIARDEHLAVRCRDDVAIAHAHFREILHAEFLEIALREVRYRDDADENALAVRDRHRFEVMAAHDFAEMAQRVVLADDDLAVERDILDARIEIRKQQRLLDMEVVERVFRLRIDLAGACRDCVEAKCLLQVRIADGRADGIRIRIAMTNDINRFRALHVKKSSSISQRGHSPG